MPPGTQSGKVLRVRGRGVPSGGSRNGGKPGDLLVIANDRAWHGRTRFTPRWDADDNRWLLRTSIMRDLARSGPHRPGGGRVIDIDIAMTGAWQ